MVNEINYTVTRQKIEEICKITLTDKQWLALSGELENLIDFHAWNEIEKNLIPQLDWLVEQDENLE